ncbi:hypothetical protein VNI00_004460 [Paramarasmius palmivorus]|uniref:Uncharacterized protein n=1 Tax=Paramarasmius palmivorus TaxID=297713 RepID=A0AAW0DKP9_9AGAR
MLNPNFFRLASRHAASSVYRSITPTSTIRRIFPSSSFRFTSTDAAASSLGSGSGDLKSNTERPSSSNSGSNTGFSEPTAPLRGALFAFITISTIYLSLSAILEGRLLYDAIQLENINIVLQSVIQIQKVEYDEYPFVRWDEYDSVANYFTHMCVFCSDDVKNGVLGVEDEDKKRRLGETMKRAAEDVHRALQMSREEPGQVAQEVGMVLQRALVVIGRELGLDAKKLVKRDRLHHAGTGQAKKEGTLE